MRYFTFNDQLDHFVVTIVEIFKADGDCNEVTNVL